jgi:hypothetical protein
VTRWRPSALAGVVLAAATVSRGAEPTVGLLLNEAPQPGLTLFAPASSSTTYLLHNDGLVVHTWSSPYRPGATGYLLEDADLLRGASLINVAPRFLNVPGSAGRVERYDWDGSLVWGFNYSGSTFISHHDLQPMPNGNVLLIAWEVVPEAEAIALGKDPDLVNGEVWIDHVIEVQPVPPSGGVIVWAWHARDHLIQDHDPTKGNYGAVEDHPELIDFNFGGAAQDFLHVNAIDYNEALDQVIVSARVFNEIWIIDHSTTTAEAAGHRGGVHGKGGDLLYRWGNPQAYRRGDAADQEFYGQHDAQWIAPGRPGAGNLLVFDNGRLQPGVDYSTLVEIVAPADETGAYPELGPGQAHGPASPVWTWNADPPSSFYSATRSGAERQPNGNTLVCLADRGRFMEIDAAGDVVWAYENPIDQHGAVNQGGNPLNNGVFNIRRYTYDLPGFAGRDLTPGDPIEGFTAPSPIPTGSLRAGKGAADGSVIDIVWNALDCLSGGHNLLFGELAAVASHELLGAACGLDPTGTHTWSGVPAADLFFLAVGTDDLGIYESSWGRDSDGAERHGTKASFLCDTTTKVVSSTCP